MAQNPYNNYIKRKAQTNVGVNPIVAPKPNNNPSVGFKKRVVGNLGGNTLTPVTQTQKSQNTSSQTTNQYTTPPEANISPSNNVQPVNNINTQPAKAKAVVDAPVAPQANTVTTETVAPMQVDNAPAMYATRSIDELNQINEIANEVIENPMMSRMARSTGKTPQQYAQELFEQQKTQLQKDWELKQQELKLQQEQAQKSWQTSVDDTDKKYNETVDKLNLNRYEQMQDLSVSATNRGLQYSPQQLGLENVANINHNKNLAEASKQRNEMLTQLNTKLMELQAQLTLGSQNAVNEYNKALGQLSADYNSKLMDWSYDKEMTAEERAWQEAQAQKDREWQEKMDKANKEWQSAENALDRAKGRSGGSYGGYGYSSSWKGNSGWKNYKGSGWSNYGNYGSGLSLDLTNEDEASVYRDVFRKESSDAYNHMKLGRMDSLNDRASAYVDLMDNQIRTAKAYGATDELMEDLINTRNTALKHLYNNSYAQSTNGDVDMGSKGDDNRGRAKAKSTSPLSADYIARVKANKKLNGYEFGSKYAYDKKDRDNYSKKAEEERNSYRYKNDNKALDLVQKTNKKLGITSDDLNRNAEHRKNLKVNSSKTVNTVNKKNNSKIVKALTKKDDVKPVNRTKAQTKKITKQVSKASTGSGIKETAYSKKVRDNVKKTTSKAVSKTKKAVKKFLSWKIKK